MSSELPEFKGQVYAWPIFIGAIMVVKALGKNKETGEEEVFELKLSASDVACFYKDVSGVAVSTKQGKVFRLVSETLITLEAKLLAS